MTMDRIKILPKNEASESVQPILDRVEKQLGFLPNLHRVMANSPAVLKGWLGLMSSLSTTLDVKTRDAIALAVSEVNACHYCLSAHSYVAATFADITPDEIALNRQGRSTDTKRDAAAQFAVSVIEKRGHIDGSEMEAIRHAGYGDGEILELIALAVQFSLTNIINNVAGTDIDFPLVQKPAALT
jgi:uncharacterized peroxidase-related enzyme